MKLPLMLGQPNVDAMKQIQKTQMIRLADVFLIGPFVIAAGLRKSDLPALFRVGLILVGVGTIGYNLFNYWMQVMTSSWEKVS